MVLLPPALPCTVQGLESSSITQEELKAYCSVAELQNVRVRFGGQGEEMLELLASAMKLKSCCLMEISARDLSPSLANLQHGCHKHYG